MLRRSSISILLLFAGLSVLAQERPPVAAVETAAAAVSSLNARSRPLRDPFAPVVTQQPGPQGAPQPVTPPVMRLKGLLRVKGRSPGALLQVGDSTMLVRGGERVLAGSTPFEVEEVGAAWVRVVWQGLAWEVR